MGKNQLVVILISVGTILLGGTAVFLAWRLTRPKPVAPLPSEAAVGGGELCALTFRVEPETTPTPTGTATPTPTSTSTPTPTPTGTATPTPTGTTTPTPTGTVTPTPTGTVTPTPTPPCDFWCVDLTVYDSNWNELTDLENLSIPQTLYFVVEGETNGNCIGNIDHGVFSLEGDWSDTIDSNQVPPQEGDVDPGCFDGTYSCYYWTVDFSEARCYDPEAMVCIGMDCR